MRLNDLNDGSIKTLLILCLLAANISLALPNDSKGTQPPGSARASRAVSAPSPKTSPAHAPPEHSARRLV